MRSRSDPQRWYRREEIARDRARRQMQRGRGAGLLPVYIAAILIALFVVYLLFLAGPAPASNVEWLELPRR